MYSNLQNTQFRFSQSGLTETLFTCSTRLLSVCYLVCFEY